MNEAYTRRRALARGAGLLAAAAGAGRVRSGQAAAPRDDGPPPLDWDRLGGVSQRMIDAFLPPPNESWRPADAVAFVRRHGTRTGLYAAVGMLLRRRDADDGRARALVEHVLAWQRNRPGRSSHGAWPNSPRRPRLDPNWREFLGLGLLMLQSHFRDQLPDDLRRRVDAALVHAAEGAARRLVPYAATNVALMNALLLVRVGEQANESALADEGRRRAAKIVEGFDRFGTFCEFNSPTYDAVDLMALAMWRSCATDPLLQSEGPRLANKLWDQIAEFYHPALANLCGPYGRAHGTDMASYSSLLRTALVATGAIEAHRSAEGMADPAKDLALRELAFVPLFVLAGVRPNAAAAQLAQPIAADKTRRVARQVEVPERLAATRVSAQLHERWMAGAGGELFAPRDQAVVAAVHWRMAKTSPVGWLAVVGEPGVSATWEQGELRVRGAAPAPSLRVRLFAGRTTEIDEASDRWTLPGMTLGFDGPPPSRPAAIVAAGQPCLELRWERAGTRTVELALGVDPPPEDST